MLTVPEVKAGAATVAVRPEACAVRPDRSIENTPELVVLVTAPKLISLAPVTLMEIAPVVLSPSI